MQANHNPNMTMRERSKFIEALKNDPSTALYVINQADLPDARNKPQDTFGDIAFMVTPSSGDNKPVLLRIPSTYVPIDLVMQGPATKADILNSADLLRLLASKRIRLIAQDEAESIIDQDAESRKEFDRMQARACRITLDPQDVYDALSGGAPEEDIQLNSNLVLVIQQYNHGEITMSQLTGHVRRMQNRLNSDDMAYLLKQVKEYQV